MEVPSGQFSQLTLAFLSVPQLGHPRVSDSINNLFADLEMMISGSGNQGLMGDAEHLTVLRQHAQQISHRAADTAAHTRIDFIKQQGAGSINFSEAGLESQQKTRHLTT